VLVLPELDAGGVTHYAHYVPLIRRLAASTRVAVIVERGSPEATAASDGLGPVELHVQRRRWPVGRAVELAVLLLRLRRRGYRAFYGSYSSVFGLVGGALGRAAGFTTAYWHCRGDIAEHFSRPLRLRRFLTATLPLWLILRLVNRVVTGTDGLAALYAKVFRLPRSKLRVVPNDVDPAWCTHGIAGNKSDRPTVLFVGRLSPPKGSRLLPVILRRVADAMPEARFVVAGGGPDEGWLDQEVRRTLSDAEVECLGYVPNTEVASLMTTAHVLLLPSLEEGFPRRLLEAMVCELPFVAADVGGVSEVVGPLAQRHLFRSGDASQAANHVIEVLQDAELGRALAEEGSRRVERYRPDAVAPLFLEAVCGGDVECRPIE
jgi:glycosyltransferase involved in cell wall biosynthesis